jgi:tol-pal system protein YbgF
MMNCRIGVMGVIGMLGLAFAPAPAAAQNREHQQMFADVRVLQEQVQRLQQAANALAEQLKTVNKRLDDQAMAQQKDTADTKLLINGLTGTVNTVREKMDGNTVAVNRLTPEISAIREGVGMLTTQLNQMLSLLQPPTNPTSAVAAGTEAPPPPAGSVTLPPSPQSYFNQAFGDYAAGRHDLAISGFKDVIEKFPNAADYTARAQFLIGESYHTLKKNREAIAAYNLLISKYPDSTQVPDAMVSRAMCFEELGQKAEARTAYEAVINKYPESSAALLATQRIKAIK